MFNFNFSQTELSFILRVLNDPRAFNYGTWYETKRESMAHWKIIKSSGSYIESVGGCKYLSATLMSDISKGARITLFNNENWTTVPGPLLGIYSLSDYRQYLVLHEFGHALASLDHPVISSLKNNALCPIMYQQTRGLKVSTSKKTVILKKNLWPLLYERQLFFKQRVY